MAIARKDKLVAGYNGNLESVIIEKNGVAVESTNGVFVVVGKLLKDQRETSHAELGQAGDLANELLFVHNSEVMYDERLQKLADFKIKAGKVARAYRLAVGDIVTLTTDLFAGAVAVDDKLVIKADGKLGVAEEGDLDTAKTVFEVIENAHNELHITMGAFAIKVIKN